MKKKKRENLTETRHEGKDGLRVIDSRVAGERGAFSKLRQALCLWRCLAVSSGKRCGIGGAERTGLPAAGSCQGGGQNRLRALPIVPMGFVYRCRQMTRDSTAACSETALW